MINYKKKYLKYKLKYLNFKNILLGGSGVLLDFQQDHDNKTLRSIKRSFDNRKIWEKDYDDGSFRKEIIKFFSTSLDKSKYGNLEKRITQEYIIPVLIEKFPQYPIVYILVKSNKNEVKKFIEFYTIIRNNFFPAEKQEKPEQEQKKIEEHTTAINDILIDKNITNKEEIETVINIYLYKHINKIIGTDLTNIKINLIQRLFNYLRDNNNYSPVMYFDNVHVLAKRIKTDILDEINSSKNFNTEQKKIVTELLKSGIKEDITDEDSTDEDITDEDSTYKNNWMSLKKFYEKYKIDAKTQSNNLSKKKELLALLK